MICLLVFQYLSMLVKDDEELVLELARAHCAAPFGFFHVRLSGGFDLDESPQALDQWNNMAGISVPWMVSKPSPAFFGFKNQMQFSKMQFEDSKFL